MIVYILHRDVDCEFGEVIGVFDTEEKALKEKEILRGEGFLTHSVFDEEYNIQEWEIK